MLACAPAADAAAPRTVKVQAERLHLGGHAERQHGGRGVLLSGRASLSGSVKVPAVSRLSLRARARRCGGWPVVSVSIGGREVARVSVRSARWRRYAKPILVGAGRRPLAVALVNGHRGRRCERAVALDAVELTPRKPEQFANPAFGDFADPMVLDVGDQHTDYYAYSTGEKLPMARSDDLVHWRPAGTRWPHGPPGCPRPVSGTPGRPAWSAARLAARERREAPAT